MLLYLLSQFLIKIKITATIIYAQEKLRMCYLKYKFFYKIEMIYYDRFDVFEGIDINKTSESKECGICYYWYF